MELIGRFIRLVALELETLIQFVPRPQPDGFVCICNVQPV